MIAKALKDLSFHEYANIFPMLEDEPLTELVDDIRENGLMNPITLYEGQILDGRNRYKACLLAGVEVRGEELAIGIDPLQFVASQNLHRRHLATSQRAMVAAKMATLKRGRPSEKNASIEANTTSEAAKLLNVGRASVQRAQQVIEHGSKELIKAVERGEVAVSAAAQLAIAEPNKAEQTKLLNEGDEAIRLKIAQNMEAMHKNLVKRDREEDKRHPNQVRLASTAMEFATMAISQLQRIRPDDEKRGEAFEKVRLWMDKQIGDDE